jgi:hypothetical protein
VAVYVSAPVLLALVTDRVISVVRRHVLGMSPDASVWARLARQLGRATLWAARLGVDFRATRAADSARMPTLPRRRRRRRSAGAKDGRLSGRR